MWNNLSDEEKNKYQEIYNEKMTKYLDYINNKH